MKIKLPEKIKTNQNSSQKIKWKVVSIWDNNDQINLNVEKNETPETAALFELGYKLVKI
jgi:hypothetical protein